MVAGYHLIWTAYGWWLPNDPRGSMSVTLRVAELAPLGELHHGRKRIQPAGKAIEEFRNRSREVLKYPILAFTRGEVRAIAYAFRDAISERAYTCYACSLMPEHVHILIRKHRDKAEEMIKALQESSASATRAKPQAERSADHPVWGGPGWKVYLDTQDDMRRVIEYIRLNPIKIKRPEQRWDFVTPYDGWMPAQTRVVDRKSKPVD